MINGYGNLYSEIAQHVAKVRGVKTTGFIEPNELSKVTNRAVQLCVLDLLLAYHRRKYATQLNNLAGIKALHHKLLLKYNWPVSEIRALTLSDVFLALHDELTITAFEGQAKNYLSNVIADKYHLSFPDILDEEWDPNLAEKFLADSE